MQPGQHGTVSQNLTRICISFSLLWVNLEEMEMLIKGVGVRFS